MWDPNGVRGGRAGSFDNLCAGALVSKDAQDEDILGTGFQSTRTPHGLIAHEMTAKRSPVTHSETEKRGKGVAVILGGAPLEAPTPLVRV